jgi:hypothetical protein
VEAVEAAAERMRPSAAAQTAGDVDDATESTS